MPVRLIGQLRVSTGVLSVAEQRVLASVVMCCCCCSVAMVAQQSSKTNSVPRHLLLGASRKCSCDGAACI